jgi:hypothetical protein
MAPSLGPRNDSSSSQGRRGPQSDKKKGCKQSQCSKWKGGKCRCGRD